MCEWEAMERNKTHTWNENFSGVLHVYTDDLRVVIPAPYVLHAEPASARPIVLIKNLRKHTYEAAGRPDPAQSIERSDDGRAARTTRTQGSVRSSRSVALPIPTTETFRYEFDPCQGVLSSGRVKRVWRGGPGRV
jgi:hypothetical protein